MDHRIYLLASININLDRGQNQLTRESFLDASTNIPDQVANHAVDGMIYLYELINDFVHCLLGFARIDPCIGNKDNDQDHDKDNDQDCF